MHRAFSVSCSCPAWLALEQKSCDEQVQPQRRPEAAWPESATALFALSGFAGAGDAHSSWHNPIANTTVAAGIRVGEARHPGPLDAPSFVRAKSFAGPRAGYVFRKGEDGIGCNTPKPSGTPPRISIIKQWTKQNKKHITSK